MDLRVPIAAALAGLVTFGLFWVMQALIGVSGELREGKPPTKVDFEKPDRAPLLFIASSEDHLMPPSVNRANYEHYQSGVVAYREFPGRTHFTAGTPGWEEVADFALGWALAPVAGILPSPSPVREPARRGNGGSRPYSWKGAP